MTSLSSSDGTYRSGRGNTSVLAKLFPSACFYTNFLKIVFHSAGLAKRGVYDDKAWGNSSVQVRNQLERIGLTIEFSGFQFLKELSGPCVIIGNHMSMMETLLLPGFFLPHMPVTFVVKESLLNYPVFKHVMRSRNPIAVTRSNPRQDLKTVMSQGVDRLSEGNSVIVFPQTTRVHGFDPSQMSSIGVKLAKKAGVPVLPLALKTDSWNNGKMLKDFGRIDCEKTAFFALSAPFLVEGKGAEEQERINGFIEQKLSEWSSLPAVQAP